MEKRQEIELLRIVGAFGIVWFHSSSIGKDIAYSGLIIFLILSMYFSAQPRLPPKPFSDRVKRLLVPWAFWFFFYGAINILLKKPVIMTDSGLTAGLLAGTSIHLWYIPFIFLAIILFDLIKKYVTSQALAYISALIIVLIFILTEFWRPWSLGLSYPWAQYIHAINGILIGVLFANCVTLPRMFLVIILFLVLVSVVVFALSFPGVGVPYFIGIIATSTVLLPCWNFNPIMRINWLSECTLGIYLSHVFWLMVIQRFNFLSSKLSLPFLAFSISAITVWCFKKVTPNISKYFV